MGGGNHHQDLRRGGWKRSIPAWAGETLAEFGRPCCFTVYPRVGGGNHPPSPSSGCSEGLSPRGRGKRNPGRPGMNGRGSIPAWAGETRWIIMIRPFSKVYPRVGGGNAGGATGSPLCRGLSPRGRGKRPAARAMAIIPRSIPAWAGETGAGPAAAARSKVYPRVGGGNSSRFPASAARQGLSPRGRGKRQAVVADLDAVGSIPAWAGETPNTYGFLDTKKVYPRVGGGNKFGQGLNDPRNGLSPRGRGKR